MPKVKINVTHIYSGKIEVPIGELVRVYLQSLVEDDRLSSKKRMTHSPTGFGIVLANGPGGGNLPSHQALDNTADIINISWKEAE